MKVAALLKPCMTDLSQRLGIAEAKGFAIYVDGKIFSSPWTENEAGAKAELAKIKKKFHDKKVEMKPITVKDTGEKPTHRGNPVHLD